MSIILRDDWDWNDHIKVWWPKHAMMKAISFGVFAQHMANRLIVGVFRYDKGKPLRRAKYLTRLKAEVAAYERTGNLEHLINAANYCFLESAAPEHDNHHWNKDAISATRDILKMKID